MKKLKKILTAVSAVAMCAVSIIPTFSGAIYIADTDVVTPYTTSFTVGDKKYVLWQEASDYFYNMDVKTKYPTNFLGSTMNVFIAEEPVRHEIYDEETWEVIGYRDVYGLFGYSTTYWSTGDDIKVHSQCCPLQIENSYNLKEEDKEKLVSYLSENNIPYEDNGLVTIINPDNNATIYDYMQTYIDIKENTGFVVNCGLLEEYVQIESAESTFPEKTLDGDANEDGKMNMADVTAIVQAIGNPDKYALTPQGIVNADSDGDGLTGTDALGIQMKVAEAGIPE